jgi:hypothetical protein
MSSIFARAARIMRSVPSKVVYAAMRAQPAQVKPATSAASVRTMLRTAALSHSLRYFSAS